MRYLLVIITVIFSVQVSEAQYQKDDFAFGYNIEVDGSGAIYSVVLPREVYSGSVQAGLVDVRIFNSNGEIVPHEIRIAKLERDNPKTAVDVPLFPLFSKKGKSGDDLSLVIKKGKNGSIISLQSDSGSSSRVVSYLLDLEEAGTYPLKLTLEWQANEGFMMPVRLESSHDLVKWKRVAIGTLADLDFMGNRLQHRELTLNRDEGRYLRLIMADGSNTFRIVGAKVVSGPQPLPIHREWITLPLLKRKEDGITYLEVEIEGAFSIDSLQLKFPQPNSILFTRLQSRYDSNVIWRNYSKKLFYTLHENGIELNNEPLKIARSANRFYRLEVLQDGTGLEKKLPKLELGYVPHELIFMARGAGPFILAVGNGSMKKEDRQNNRTILQDFNDGKGNSLIHKAALTEKLVLGGETVLQLRSVRPWKKIILWLVLVGGVVILGIMVWSLSRKMS